MMGVTCLQSVVCPPQPGQIGVDYRTLPEIHGRIAGAGLGLGVFVPGSRPASQSVPETSPSGLARQGGGTKMHDLSAAWGC